MPRSLISLFVSQDEKISCKWQQEGDNYQGNFVIYLDDCHIFLTQETLHSLAGAIREAVELCETRQATQGPDLPPPVWGRAKAKQGAEYAGAASADEHQDALSKHAPSLAELAGLAQGE